MDRHHIPSSIDSGPTTITATIKAATHDFMSPLSTLKGQIYEPSGNIAQGGNGGGG
jgi:hypothetical protein